jgi:antitoxin (DNA-binding transcriptional repressor) of toxin-antitoxin stability system
MEKEKAYNTISATALRADASDILGKVKHAHQTFVIEVHGNPSATLKPYNEVELSNTLVLSERDTQIFLHNLDNPPAPNAYLKKAMQKYLQRYV